MTPGAHGGDALAVRRGPLRRALDPLVCAGHGGMHALVSAAHAGALLRALFEGEGLEPLGVGGRGAVYRVACAAGDAVVRECRRGGAMAALLGNAYMAHNRPLREFELHRALYAEGLPVVKPLGVRWQRSGAVYRGAIATAYVPARDLRSADRTPALLRACGAAVRALHDAGVWHADLNLGNLLDAPGGPLVLDLDKARRTRTLGRTARARNLLRLRRSFDKHGFDAVDFAALLEGYGPIDMPRWLDTLYACKRRSAGAPGPRA